MQRAKEVAQNLLHKSGHHDTTTHETVAPAVTQETRRQLHHEQVQTVVDKDIHKDHYHTTVQPVLDRQVLPEKHETHVAATENRQFDHGSGRDIQAQLQQERAQFSNKAVDGGVQQTHETAATLVGERRHHHVHEVIQPVIQKEVIQPEVHHTIVPIHEVHREAAVNHGTTTMPAISMQAFKQQGGALGGAQPIQDGFQGEPVNVGNTTVSTGHQNTQGNVQTGHSTTSKPSLLQKLNPKTDTNNDGKAGIMS